MRLPNPLLTALAVCLLLQMGLAIAAAPALVEVVQAPAWVERDGRRQPLATGMELRSGDVVLTGGGAKAYLLLAEGSRVKLGEGARFGLQAPSTNPRTHFRGALDVITGAFRFTTARLKKALPRDVSIRVGTATVGIRGTDIWGKTDKDGDLVALLEGRIAITRDGQSTELSQAMTYYDAPRGQSAAVRSLDRETFVRLARQTDILPGAGAAGRRGVWYLLLGSPSSQAGALDLYDAARDAGFAARIRLRERDAVTHYDVVLAGFPSASDAEAAAARLKAATELKPVVQR